MEDYDNFRKIVGTVCNLGIRSVLVSIPVIGPVMDVFYTEGHQYVANKFRDELIENIDMSKVDKKFLYSFEFQNLLFRTIKLVLNEINKDKISFYSKLIKNSLESSEKDRRYNFEYINLVSELSVEQMHILLELYNQQKEIYKIQKEYQDIGLFEIVYTRTNWRNLPQILENTYEIELEDVDFLLKRIESTGLIKETFGSSLDYGSVYIITPNLIKFFDKLTSYEWHVSSNFD